MSLMSYVTENSRSFTTHRKHILHQQYRRFQSEDPCSPHTVFFNKLTAKVKPRQMDTVIKLYITFLIRVLRLLEAGHTKLQISKQHSTCHVDICTLCFHVF